MDLREGLAEYLRVLEFVEHKSRRTLESYSRDLSAYLTWLSGQGIETAEAVTPVVADAYFSWLNSRMAASSASRALSAIKGFHAFLCLQYGVTVNPVRDFHAFKGKSHLPSVLDKRSMKKLLDSFDDSEEGIYAHAMLELLYACGLRVSELCALTVQDINLEEGLVHVIHGKGDKERFVPVARDCLDILKTYKIQVRPVWSNPRKRSSIFFLNKKGNPVTRQMVHALIKKSLAEAGLDTSPSAHSFRHSFASELLAGDADLRVVQELLGHADIETTTIYTHIQDDRLKSGYDTALEGLFESEGE